MKQKFSLPYKARVKIRKRVESVREAYKRTFGTDEIDTVKLATFFGFQVIECSVEEIACDAVCSVDTEKWHRTIMVRDDLSRETKRLLIAYEIGIFLMTYRGGKFDTNASLQELNPEGVYFVECLLLSSTLGGKIWKILMRR